MIVDIKQHSFSNRYDIYINDEKSYRSAFTPDWFKAHLQLITINNDNVVYTMKKKGWFNSTYIIESSLGQTLEFVSKRSWSTQYFLKHENDTYDLYGHLGRKYSIYKNGQQVAWWDKEKITKYEADTYQIVADNDANIELLICFCLIIDLKDSPSNDGNTVTYDFGNIGPEAKKFDKSWVPNEAMNPT